jgi:hypothetical protein
MSLRSSSHPGPYFTLTDQPIPLIVQFALFAAVSCVMLAQIYFYRVDEQRRSILKAALLFVILMGLSAGIWMFFDRMFVIADEQAGETPSLAPFIVGGILPGAMLVAGFVPQIVEICQCKSSEAFSLGLSLIDFTGASSGFISVWIETQDWGAAAPFLGICFSQIVMMTLCLVVYPLPGRFSCGSSYNNDPNAAAGSNSKSNSVSGAPMPAADGVKQLTGGNAAGSNNSSSNSMTGDRGNELVVLADCRPIVVTVLPARDGPTHDGASGRDKTNSNSSSSSTIASITKGSNGSSSNAVVPSAESHAGVGVVSGLLSSTKNANTTTHAANGSSLIRSDSEQWQQQQQQQQQQRQRQQSGMVDRKLPPEAS